MHFWAHCACGLRFEALTGVLLRISESRIRRGLLRLCSYVLSPGWVEKQACGSSFSRSNLKSLNNWVTLSALTDGLLSDKSERSHGVATRRKSGCSVIRALVLGELEYKCTSI